MNMCRPMQNRELFSPAQNMCEVSYRDSKTHKMCQFFCSACAGPGQRRAITEYPSSTLSHGIEDGLST